MSGTTDRGVSPLIGYILIISIVAVSASAIVALGGPAIAETLDQADEQNTRNTFSKFDSSMSAVAYSEGKTSRDVTLSSRKPKETTVQNTGHIEVRYESNNNDNSTVIFSEDLGAVKYEQSEKSSIIYQGSGVWQMDEETQETDLISPPEFSYEKDTLVIPMIAIGGEYDTYTSRDLQLKKNNSGTTSDTQRTIEDATIVVEIQSEAYKGWAQYYQNRVSERVDVQYDHSSDTVTFYFETQKEDVTVEDGFVTNSQFSIGQGGKVTGDITSGGSVQTHPSSDTSGNIEEYADTDIMDKSKSVEDKIEAIRSDCTELTGSESEITAGDYCTNGETSTDGDMVFNVSDGDIEVALDDNFFVRGGDIIVKDGGTDNEVLFYTNDGYVVENGNTVGNSDNPEQVQLYGTEDAELVVQSGSTYNGIVIIFSEQSDDDDRSEVDNNKDKKGSSKATLENCTEGEVCIANGGDVTGAVISDKVSVLSGGELHFDERLTGTSYSIELNNKKRPSVTHLHISTSEVIITED